MVIPLVLIGAALYIPAWYRGVRAKQLKTAVRKVAIATTADERRAAEDAAIANADNQGKALLDLADAAAALNQTALAERAIALVEQQGTFAADVKAFRKRTAVGPPPSREHPFEIAMAAKRLRDEGRDDAARERIDAALQRWPDDPELLAAKAELSGDQPARS